MHMQAAIMFARHLSVGLRSPVLTRAFKRTRINLLRRLTPFRMLFDSIARSLENVAYRKYGAIDLGKPSVFKGMAAELQGLHTDQDFQGSEASTAMDISPPSPPPWDTSLPLQDPSAACNRYTSVPTSLWETANEDAAMDSDEESYVASPICKLRRSRFDEMSIYREVGTLGYGGNGKCLLLERQPDKQLRACKITHGIKNTGCTQILREVRMLRDILQPNDRVLRIYDFIQSPRQCQIYTEYCNGGDLSDLINHYRMCCLTIPESFLWHAFLQLAEGLSFIHCGYDHSLGLDSKLPKKWQQVIHADLKPENIFLRLFSNGNNYPDLVIADFGASQLAPGHGYIGTYQWCPPEIPYYSAKGDVWAMGAIIHALAHGGLPPIASLPNHIPSSRENYLEWSRSRESRLVTPLTEYSCELEDCMREAMWWDAKERYSSYEVLQSVGYEISMGVASLDIWEPLMPGWEERRWRKW